jgi:glycosyltransferase involved in cell wall biosynthesis
MKFLMKTIGIDCRLAGDKHAGIGRYIEELVKRVVKDTSIQWVLFFSELNQISIPKQGNIKIVIAPVRHYSVAEQIKMPGIFAKENLDLLHVPHFNVPLLYSGPFIITIHDLLWHTQSNAGATTLSPLVHGIKYRAYKFVTHYAVHHATKIIVPAETVKEDILRLFPKLQNEKIVVTYEGVNEKFQNPDTKIQPNSKILFYTGSLYPHKNLMVVVLALKQLPEYQLYISSSRTVFGDQFLEQVKSAGVEDRVRHLGRLSDDELIEQYQKSFALVQPSLSEGFGLTGVEAMAAGLPVIASDIPIFQEIYQDACVFFDPKKIDSFVSAVRRLENDQEKMSIRGQEVASQYSWDTMATETLQIYLNAMSS